jgi:hypothetical protein
MSATVVLVLSLEDANVKEVGGGDLVGKAVKGIPI